MLSGDFFRPLRPGQQNLPPLPSSEMGKPLPLQRSPEPQTKRDNGGIEIDVDTPIAHSDLRFHAGRAEFTVSLPADMYRELVGLGITARTPVDNIMTVLLRNAIKANKSPMNRRTVS